MLDNATTLRAQQLTAIGELIDPPAAVTAAIRASQAAAQMRPPPWPNSGAAAAQATAAAAAQLARRALDDPSALAAPLDVSAISAARDGEQADRDRIAVIAGAQEAARLLLCATVDEHQAAIIEAIQARHAEVLGKLIKCAKRLPPGADEQVALAQGGQTRLDYLSAVDATATAAALRNMLATVENDPPTELPDALAITVAYERTGLLHKSWVPSSWSTSYGDPRTLGFWLTAGREPGYEWWLPTSAQLRQRVSELRDQRRRQQAAGLPVRPPSRMIAY